MASNRDHPARIIVKNYPSNTTTRDLQIMFEKYGRIDDLFTPKERDSDKPRNFSFIRYRRVENAEEAIRGMNGREIDGHKLLVEFAHRFTGPKGIRDSNRGGGNKKGDSRFRRRSASPRRFRSRSPSPKDRWHMHEREPDHGGRYPPPLPGDRDMAYHDPYGPPPPFSNRMGGYPPHFPPHNNRMMHEGAPPPHGPPTGGPPPHGPPTGGPPPYNSPHPMGMPPSGGHGGGPPRPGRKILLDTPQGLPSGGGHFDGSRPPQQSYSGPPLHRDSGGLYRGPPSYQSDGGYSGPRDHYQDPYSGPPSRGNAPSNRGGYTRGPPPQDSYGRSEPPGTGRGYYDDQYNSSQPAGSGGYSRSQGNNYPPVDSGGQQYHDSYDTRHDYGKPPAHRSQHDSDDHGYQRSDGYRYSGSDNYRSPPRHQGGPPVDRDYNSSGYEYDSFRPPGRGQYSGGGPNQFGNNSYNRDRSDYYQSDYSNTTPQKQPIDSPSFASRQYSNYKGPSPPMSKGPTDSYYSEQRSPPNRRDYSGPPYGSSSSNSTSYTSQSTGYGTNSTTRKGTDSVNSSNTSTGNPNRNPSFASPPHPQQSKYSSYAMSSYSTGYGGGSSLNQSGSSQSNQSSGVSQSTSSTSANRAGGTNTGYIPSQGYTKPGPPF